MINNRLALFGVKDHKTVAPLLYFQFERMRCDSCHVQKPRDWNVKLNRKEILKTETDLLIH